MGVDSRADLARAEAFWQARRREEAMSSGVTLLDPESVYFAYDTVLGRDVVVGPNVVFGPGVEVAEGVEIKAFSHIEGARIGAGATIGPFARLRPGTDIGEDVHIGNFVELKNTTMSPGAKANHLAYVGDTEVGERANIGAGTITCNYDGFEKHRRLSAREHLSVKFGNRGAGPYRRWSDCRGWQYRISGCAKGCAFRRALQTD